ncbi:MAG: hypothetical protein F6J93_23370 [Oscillatoria sp. SIO1A7]|nr:hypothetical protein [Oscillatoria sp. SIO1A7]
MLPILYLTSKALIVALLFLSRRQIARFLKRHSQIANSQDLQAFMKMARQQMYATLLYVVLLIPSFILMFLLLMKGAKDAAIVMSVETGVFIFTRIDREGEKRSRNLPCATPELEASYGNVCKSWVNDAFPKF